MLLISDLTNIRPIYIVNIYVRIIILILGILLSGGLSAQKTIPSIMRQDTTVNRPQVKKIKIKDDFIPNPKKALIYSLVLPGAGQIYNRKYWKLPLVYSAYGGLIYAFDFNGRQFKKYKRAYQFRLDENTEEADKLVNPRVSTAAIKQVRDGARKNLELTYMAAIVVHALNGIEAFVDAHLRNFDVSEDLSLSIRPTFESSGLGVQSGVGLFLTF